ncbi:MAG: VOC family protein [Methanofollis sp.]|uniref:VOC family protein n=1 Tax=Methanofollis sp. TaxID=2052835 RepID=UPI00260809A8|nr:VOC family protein [Methanofollis sp.]MDD4253890.1 VOC family protein [Methanofollis sp.]
MDITFRSTVLFVRDMEQSKAFYTDVLGQKVELDLGVNVGFVGGLALWDRTYVNDLLYAGKMPPGEAPAPPMEVYFETAEIEALAGRVAEAGVRFLHPLQEQPWAQRAVRFFDPDGHLVEVAEPMPAVVARLAAEGLSDAGISERTTLPPEVVAAMRGSECCD